MLQVRQRAISHAGCPYCSGKLVCPCNSLSGQHPELAAQWDLRRNRGIRAEQTRPTSFDKAWWKHTWHHGGEEKMHGWMCRVSYRVKDPEGTSCPHCRSAAYGPHHAQACLYSTAQANMPSGLVSIQLGSASG